MHLFESFKLRKEKYGRASKTIIYLLTKSNKKIVCRTLCLFETYLLIIIIAEQ